MAMRLLVFLFLVSLTAADILNVASLPIFSSLPPCVQSGVLEAFSSVTACPDANHDVTSLQQCFCSTSANSRALITLASSRVSRKCWRRMDITPANIASGQTMVTAFCRQGNDDNTPITFPTPTIPVSERFVDLLQLRLLPPCVSEAIRSEVPDFMDDYCPPVPVAAHATCACSYSEAVARSITSRVKDQCGDRFQSDFVTSYPTTASSLWNDYCNTVLGRERADTGVSALTTSSSSASPSPSFPPLSFHLTNLLRYYALTDCQRLYVSRAVYDDVTKSYCNPDDPARFASCLCLQTALSSSVSANLTYRAKRQCSPLSKPASLVASITNIFDVYCSLARDEMQATPTRIRTSLLVAGGYITETAWTGPFDDDVDYDDGGDDDSKNKKRVIIGAVVGSVGGVAVLAGVGIFFFLRRKAQKRRQLEQQQQQQQQLPQNEQQQGTPELPDQAKPGNLGELQAASGKEAEVPLAELPAFPSDKRG